ncbi:MAG TPA: peptidoglycan DD-metalloendopeptidase family protein [Actinomycetota bacterium]|nr:peptidoglycan DD-metalloendopeptidase family protein [Actinomycetota bacterium]
MAGALLAAPVGASTEGELQAAEARLERARQELTDIANRYAAAQMRLAELESRLQALRARIGRLEARLRAIGERMEGRVVEVFKAGGVATAQLLLASESVSEFTDRLQFVDRINAEDADLQAELRRTREELRRARREVQDLLGQQEATLRELARQREQASARLEALRGLVAELERRVAEERARRQALAEAAARAVGGGPLQACPVGQPRAFGNDFGQPRPGGRVHQGIDILAPLGTPVYAAQSGVFVKDYNALGGISAFVRSDGGDTTYYAHLSAYAGVPSGAHVAAGTMIGRVGNTGNAQGGPYHLHFEYHPGGGAAVNPYSLLRAVCG